MQNVGKKTGVLSVLYILIAVIFVGFYIYNTINMNAQLLVADQWEWAKHIIVPFENGEMSFWKAITYEYSTFSHSHIITLIAFITDYKFMGFDLNSDRFVGVVSSLCIVLLLGRIGKDEFNRPILGLAVGSIFVMASTNEAHFSWTLLQIQQYTSLIAFIAIYWFHRRYESKNFYAGFAAIIVFVSLLGGAISIAALLSIICVMALQPKRNLFPIVFGLICLLVVNLGLDVVIDGQRAHVSSSQSFFSYAAAEPQNVFKGILNMLSRVFYYYPSSKWGGHQTLGFITLIVILSCVLHYAFIAKRAYGTTAIIMIGMVGIWSLGVIQSRLITYGVNYVLAPRYSIFMHLAAIGVVFYIATALNQQKPNVLKIVLPIIVICLGALNGIEAYKASTKRAHYVKRYLDVRYEAMKTFPDDLQIKKLIRNCAKDNCDEALGLMQDKRINIFDEVETP